MNLPDGSKYKIYTVVTKTNTAVNICWSVINIGFFFEIQNCIFYEQTKISIFLNEVLLIWSRVFQEIQNKKIRWEDNRTAKLTHTKLYRMNTSKHSYTFFLSKELMYLSRTRDRQTESVTLTTRNKYSRIPWHFCPVPVELQFAPGFKAGKSCFHPLTKKKKNSSLSLSSKMASWLPYHLYFFFSLSRSHMCYVFVPKQAEKLEQYVCYK